MTMQTKVIKITDPKESVQDLKEAARILREGGLVVFPTETVYGLGGNGLSKESAERIYAPRAVPPTIPLSSTSTSLPRQTGMPIRVTCTSVWRRPSCPGL